LKLIAAPRLFAVESFATELAEVRGEHRRERVPLDVVRLTFDDPVSAFSERVGESSIVGCADRSSVPSSRSKCPFTVFGP
jgi:hypothetical protein